jgi:hypothetical protein
MIRVLMVAALTVMPAHSWYSAQCCGERDCKPVPCEELVETPHGWKYLPTGNEFVNEQVRPSQDRFCHVCLGGMLGSAVKRSICAFIRQGV